MSQGLLSLYRRERTRAAVTPGCSRTVNSRNVMHTHVSLTSVHFLWWQPPYLTQLPFPTSSHPNPITSCSLGVPPLPATNKGLCGTLSILWLGSSFLKGVCELPLQQGLFHPSVSQQSVWHMAETQKALGSSPFPFPPCLKLSSSILKILQHFILLLLHITILYSLFSPNRLELLDGKEVAVLKILMQILLPQ